MPDLPEQSQGAREPSLPNREDEERWSDPTCGACGREFPAPDALPPTQGEDASARGLREALDELTESDLRHAAAVLKRGTHPKLRNNTNHPEHIIGVKLERLAQWLG